jgi:hypothetical protein
MLSEAQQRQFATDGYVLIPSFVPEHLLASVDKEIDVVESLDPPDPETKGTRFYFLPPERLPASEEAIRASGAFERAEELTSPHPLVHGYGHIQIALTIPHWEHTPGGPHLDGYHDPERPYPFTLLAGIFLSDERQPGSGNLWVWPGSHRSHAELFRSDGVMALMPSGGHSTLLDPPLSLGDPTPILAKRGDLLLAHYLLGHNSGGNTTSRTRRAIYYRLSTADHNDRWAAALADPFLEYPSLRP